ncbi:DUF418 domain-containing protein [Pseudoduganella sp. GCM10020061]|uniref:DUF418 domain-containing protein n=1 Tax=Pseudoduganella sp. GCM10020061 TaxID=3317345 RepID=UPI00363ECCF3
MSIAHTGDAHAPASPLAGPRIETLDVIRGFALLGICLMNVMFFNRSIHEVQTGFPPGLTGIDLAAAVFVGYFVTGKFWTMFSLLFGMGFAVMLTRAEKTGRPFAGPYVRRILGLAAFGAFHHILIWGGDILLTYALTATFLLLALRAHWMVFAVLLAGLFGALFFVHGAAPLVKPTASTLAYCAFTAMFLRDDKRIAGLPRVALVLWAGAALSLLAVVLMATGVLAADLRTPVTIYGIQMLLGAIVTSRNQPASSRPWRAGALLWTLMFGTMVITGAMTYMEERKAAAETAAGAPPAALPAPLAAALQKRAERIEKDAAAVSTGTYADAIAVRTEHFVSRPLRETGFALGIFATFMIGVWFIRSGVMENSKAHLPLFRRLAMTCIPLGLLTGLAGSPIATSLIPGVNHGAWQFANGLILLSSLPTSIGYTSLIVLMYHSRSSLLSKVRLLAPFGRMALTNYVMQSLVMSLIFYGYGLGQWGMGRAAQLAVALSVSLSLVALSHVWLSYFRYGPLEWLWRAVTYLKLPAMRAERAPAAGALAAG